MTAAYEDIKGAVVEAINARLAESQPAHQTLQAVAGTPAGLEPKPAASTGKEIR